MKTKEGRERRVNQTSVDLGDGLLELVGVEEVTHVVAKAIVEDTRENNWGMR